MNNPTLTQLLLSISETFAVASMIGAASYGFVKLVRKWCPNSSGEVLALVVGFPTFGFLVLIYMIYVPAMCLGALMCLGSANAEDVINNKDRTYGFHYSTVLSATALALNTSFIAIVGNFSLNEWTMAAFFLGILSGSSAVPIIIWMFRTSKLRPGIDRHLNSDDEPM